MSVTASPFYPSPAFNIDKKDILFTTLVDGTAGKTGASYKFTLLDSGMNVQITDSVITKTGNTITIPYEITGKKKIMFHSFRILLPIRYIMPTEQRLRHMVS